MKILVTGGNGNISWWFVQLAFEQGHDVYVIGRSFDKPTRRELPVGVHKIVCDIRDFEATKRTLAGLHFDVICDFICYNKEQARQAIELYKEKTDHYIFISSEAIYKRETKFLPFKETTPIADLESSGNYIKGKIEAEIEFKKAYESLSFPLTIIRPSFTYDTLMPTSIGFNCYTAIRRYKEDNIAIVAGDGNNLWTFTHARDFAHALLGVILNKRSIGEDYHITSNEWLTWMDATKIILDALQLPNAKILNIPKQFIFKDSFFGERDLLSQKMSHNIFDNTKIKKLLPQWSAKINFANGVAETLKWLDESSLRKRINSLLDRRIQNLYELGE